MIGAERWIEVRETQGTQKTTQGIQALGGAHAQAGRGESQELKAKGRMRMLEMG